MSLQVQQVNDQMLALSSSLQYKPKNEIRLSQGWQVPRSLDQRDRMRCQDEYSGDAAFASTFQQTNEHLSCPRSVYPVKQAFLHARH